ncbi:MAG: hypothetical protein H7A15_05120 [Sinobacteraceae bacterium]|nr:hypothetical protein [Nevskiaceae bacterium]
MLCSARELGLSETHEGILELPADTPIGQEPARAHAARRHGARAERHPESRRCDVGARPGPRSGGLDRSGLCAAQQAPRRRRRRRPPSPAARPRCGPGAVRASWDA